VPADISAAVGVYTALSVVLLGANVPAPPLHVPDVADPPTEPARVTFGLAAQTVWSIPALTVGDGLIVIKTWSLVAVQVPGGSLVVKVNVTVPAVISAAVGVYTALSVELFGVKVPAPPLHVPEVADPPTTPASVTFGAPAQTTWSVPAFTVAAGLIVITT
jgi:hypothetical protein